MDPLLGPGWDEEWVDPYPLHTAASDGDLDAVRRLVAEGWDLDAFDDYPGWTPLQTAAEANRLDVVSFLIEAGADVNAYNEPKIGETPLGQVAGECSLAMARLLVDAGADPTIRGWMWLTALDQSADREDEEGKRVHELLVHAARRFGRIPPSDVGLKKPHVGKRRRRR